jgi:hypothetical protein
MSYPSRSEEWDRVRKLEDALALLCQATERLRIIRVQAWNQGDWARVYAEATGAQQNLSNLKKLLSDRWGELFAEVTNDASGG